MEKTFLFDDHAPFVENSSNAQGGRQRLSSQSKEFRQKASQLQMTDMTQFNVFCKWCEGQRPASGHYYSTYLCGAMFVNARLKSPNITDEGSVRITMGVWKKYGCPMCCTCVTCNLRVEAYEALVEQEEESRLVESAFVLSSMHATGTGTTGTGVAEVSTWTQQ